VANSKERTHISYSRLAGIKDTISDTKVKAILQKITISIENVEPIINNIFFLLGGNMGWIKGEAKFNGGKEKENAFTGGIKVGILYNINIQNEIELGTKLNANFFEEVVCDAGAYVGYNFKF
jgi:hypothetical protein